jgi:hypothetical protein
MHMLTFQIGKMWSLASFWKEQSINIKSHLEYGLNGLSLFFKLFPNEVSFTKKKVRISFVGCLYV